MKYDVLPLASVKYEVESTKDQPHQPSNFNLQPRQSRYIKLQTSNFKLYNYRESNLYSPSHPDTSDVRPWINAHAFRLCTYRKASQSYADRSLWSAHPASGNSLVSCVHVLVATDILYRHHAHSLLSWWFVK